MSLLICVLLLPWAILVFLPALSDGWQAVMALLGPGSPPGPDSRDPSPTFLILVPAHDEELLVGRCVRSLRKQSYHRGAVRLVVVADNCSDATADVARAAGAEVLIREVPFPAGKQYAIAWALGQIRSEWDALVIVDADSVCAADLLDQLADVGGLRSIAVQAYDGMSNEEENDLTRLAGLLVRARYELVLPLKHRTGLACPLTGNGIAIGRDLYEQLGWRPETITEGWELYTRFTLAGRRCVYCREAVVLAQGARSLEQGMAQRVRWTAGRIEVLRRNVGRILTTPGVRVVQRIDLVAELASLGPVTRSGVAAVGMALAALVAWRAASTFALVLMGLYGLALAQPVLYTGIVLVYHPEPGRALRALLHLPWYATWRLCVAFRMVLSAREDRWIRSVRHAEGDPPVTSDRGQGR